jgi:hypothetical protein
MNLPNFNKAKAGLLATLAIGTMAVASGFSPVNKMTGVELQKPAQAYPRYQSWEHPWSGLDANVNTQAQADKMCRDNYRAVGAMPFPAPAGKITWYTYDGWLLYFPWQAYVWAHLGNRHCVLNVR